MHNHDGTKKDVQTDGTALTAALGSLVVLAVLGLIGFALWWTESSGVLWGLCAPWFLIGLFGQGIVGGGIFGGRRSPGTEESEIQEPSRRKEQSAAWAWLIVGIVCLLGSLGLVGYGVWLSKSAQPLWVILAACVAFGVGAEAGERKPQDEGEEGQQ